MRLSELYGYAKVQVTCVILFWIDGGAVVKKNNGLAKFVFSNIYTVSQLFS